jgi:hypothetical protein
MDCFATEGKTVGLVFDMTLCHHSTGERLLDMAKKAVCKVIKGCFADEVDGFYLYHPQLVEVLYTNGQRVGAVGNYGTDGWRFNLELALKQTLYVAGAERYSDARFVVLVTDRMEDTRPLAKLLYLNQKDLIDAHVIVVGVGDRYDRAAVEAALSGHPATHIHVDDPSTIPSHFIKEAANGQQDVRSKAAE